MKQQLTTQSTNPSTSSAKCFDTLAQCLSKPMPDILAQLNQVLHSAATCNAIPFEVIAGTPFSHYGARLTFRPEKDAAALARVFGLESHPWGVPTWVGVRVKENGEIESKAYHELKKLDDRFVLPKGLPTAFTPVMASLHRGSTELYLRYRPATNWDEFVKACTQSLGVTERDFSPYPRPHEDAFCLSLRWHQNQLQSISLFADQRALPDDSDIYQAWTQDMTTENRHAYDIAYAGVRSLGPRVLGGWHAMLAWTYEESGLWHRAASFRIPPLTKIPD